MHSSKPWLAGWLLALPHHVFQVNLDSPSPCVPGKPWLASWLLTLPHHVFQAWAVAGQTKTFHILLTPYVQKKGMAAVERSGLKRKYVIPLGVMSAEFCGWMLFQCWKHSLDLIISQVIAFMHFYSWTFCSQYVMLTVIYGKQRASLSSACALICRSW